jgi:hypothetical protein
MCAKKPGENNLDSSASESASERVVAEYLRSTGGVIPSYAECLTTSRKCLILLAFESFEAVRSGGEGVVPE